jgi:hypothetical protein
MKQHVLLSNFISFYHPVSRTVISVLEASPSVDNCWVHNKLYSSKKINPRGQGQSDTVTVWRPAYLKRYFLSRAHTW